MRALPLIALASSALLLAGCTAPPPTAGQTMATETTSASTTAAPTASPTADAAPFRALESRYSARLGVYAVDTGTGRTVEYRSGERFTFASTYKALAAGVLLKTQTDAELDAVVRYSASDLVDYSPVTEKHVASGMTVRAIIAAALQYSDNTAANLLLEQLGGPADLTSALRSLGDDVTNVDRTEPDVNTATPGDPRDTTTPAAIAGDLRGFVLGGTLSRTRAQELRDLLLGNTTGAPWIRAGVPAGWRVADKTGNASYGTRNDIAVVYPSTGDPIVLALLSDRGVEGAASDDDLLADATKAVVEQLR
ncbi:beta-lactamase class A [Frondihabitans sp. PhB188]|uniref:class A beta-lactamase n=1 Tax=Frondihabitans sp. PhB188 TaxID=2485200 RepID=UPI000FA8ECE8|nr:class A beta-lactamase [Frondihabitans sp. PhB188]ROQ38479.1 beta-lactamase class A [Frondihabitans sp. PhB188]